LASASLAQTNYFDPPVGGIEYQVGDIFNDFIKPIVNHYKDDILDSLGIFPPTSIGEGIDWVSEHPIGGGHLIVEGPFKKNLERLGLPSLGIRILR